MLAFIFDVDDTLYEQTIPFKNAYKKLFSYDINIEEFYHLSRYYSDLKFEEFRDGKMTMDEYHIYRVKEAAKDLSIFLSDKQALDFQKEYKKNQKNLTLSKTTKEILNYCVENNIILGVITNGMSEHQWGKIKTLELEKWIPKENIAVSFDIGVNKPNVKIFETIEKRINIPKENIFYIGDSLENDIVGANNAEWNSIWINRYKKTKPKDLKTYSEVNNNEQLFKVLKNIVENNKII